MIEAVISRLPALAVLHNLTHPKVPPTGFPEEFSNPVAAGVCGRRHPQNHLAANSVTLIHTQSDFDSLCRRIEQAGIVAFDTEFVSESYYRPRLCLLQFALPGETVGVDPFEIENLTPWWEIMVDSQTTVVIHGGREEIRFCQFATRNRPHRLVDVQIAEGLQSRGYPMSYGNLVSRVLGRSIKHGKETRTDWERRPLTDQQINYALEDVRHLIEVWETQRKSLTQSGRLEWADAEFERFIDLVLAEEDRDGWLKLPSFGRLNRREMLLAQRLYEWRRTVAEQSNRPQRRVFRDDMLMEVARRQPTSVRELNMTRGMNRRDYQQFADEIIDVVNAVQEIPDQELPRKTGSPQYPAQDEVLARILGLALADRCQELGISTSLVGTTADLKHLVRWHAFGARDGDPPKLLEGWRGDVCGQLLVDVLDGKVKLSVADPKSENPLRFDIDP